MRVLAVKKAAGAYWVRLGSYQKEDCIRSPLFMANAPGWLVAQTSPLSRPQRQRTHNEAPKNHACGFHTHRETTYSRSVPVTLRISESRSGNDALRPVGPGMIAPVFTWSAGLLF